jgi:hypothetical protein
MGNLEELEYLVYQDRKVKLVVLVHLAFLEGKARKVTQVKKEKLDFKATQAYLVNLVL